jgi:hypothetical protein
MRREIKMKETSNIAEALSKSKIVGYFLALWGATFFFMPLAYLSSYIINGTSEAFVTVVLYIIADLAEIAAALVLWVISAKILRTSSK